MDTAYCYGANPQPCAKSTRGVELIGAPEERRPFTFNGTRSCATSIQADADPDPRPPVWIPAAAVSSSGNGASRTTSSTPISPISATWRVPRSSTVLGDGRPLGRNQPHRVAFLQFVGVAENDAGRRSSTPSRAVFPTAASTSIRVSWVRRLCQRRHHIRRACAARSGSAAGAGQNCSPGRRSSTAAGGGGSPATVVDRLNDMRPHEGRTLICSCTSATCRTRPRSTTRRGLRVT
jgi:hypothetical protein